MQLEQEPLRFEQIAHSDDGDCDGGAHEDEDLDSRAPAASECSDCDDVVLAIEERAGGGQADDTAHQPCPGVRPPHGIAVVHSQQWYSLKKPLQTAVRTTHLSTSPPMLPPRRIAWPEILGADDDDDDIVMVLFVVCRAAGSCRCARRANQ